MSSAAKPRIDITEIGPEKLIRMQTAHVAILLFDVRSEEIFAQGNIKGSVRVDSPNFVANLTKMVPQKDTPIVIYDDDGVKAGDLVLAAEQAGFINVVNLEGGYTEYLKVLREVALGEF